MAKELQLNSAVAKKEANVKSVCQSLKKKLQEKHPELDIANELKNINNGFQIVCPGWTFDVVRYQKWVRLDILKAGEKQAKFYKTDAPEVRDVVTIFISKIDEALAKAATEQPAKLVEEPKTVTPLKWVSETGMNGTSGFYACLGDKQLAHISTCGMIYWMTDDITTLDRSNINAKASRVYHEWMNGYATASDEEKENTYIRPNLTTADSFDMSRDLKKVELRERQPEKYKNYPTRAEWLNTWKHEMFELLKQDGYKYPSDVSTNSNRKGERTMKTLRFNSAKADDIDDIEVFDFKEDTEITMPVSDDDILDALQQTSAKNKDNGLLIVKFTDSNEEPADPKMPYLAYIQPAAYSDNAKINKGDTSAIVYVKYVDYDYRESKEIKMPVAEVATYLDSVKTTPVKGNSSRKTYLRRKLDALNSNADTNTSNQYYVWVVKGDGLSAEVYNKIGTQGFTSDVLTKYGKKTFKASANDIEAFLAAMSDEYNIDPISVVRRYRTDNTAEVPVGYRTSTNSSRSDYRRRKLDALNSAKLPVGATSKSEVDNEFLNDVDSILSLSTGDTIDVDAAYLAYNPETKELILSDESETTLDSGFVIIGEFTPDNDALAKIAGKEPELEPDETDDEFADNEMSADESEEMPERDPHVPTPEDEAEPESEGGIFQ